jgi:hypothetical protein
MALDPELVKPAGLDGDMSGQLFVPAAMALDAWEPLDTSIHGTNEYVKSSNPESGIFNKLFRSSSSLFRGRCDSQCSTMDTIAAGVTLHSDSDSDLAV